MKMKLPVKIKNILKDKISGKERLFKEKSLRRILFILVLSVGVILLGFRLNLLSLLPEKRGWQDYLHQADQFYRSGKLQKAKDIYFEIQKKFPSNPQMDWINFQLASIFRESGLLHRATFFYEKVASNRSSPLYFEASYQLAQCYKEVGDAERCLEFTQKLIREFPQSEKVSEFYLMLADCLFKKSDEEKAISIYKKIIKDYPATVTAEKAYLKLGNIYFTRKRYSDAILFYSSLFKEYPQAEVLEEALFNLSRCYLARGQVEEALSVLLFLSERYPRSLLFIRGMFLTGDALLKKGEVKRAQEIFKKIEEIYKEEPEFSIQVKRKLAETFMAEQKYQEAAKVYESLIQNYPYLGDEESICFTLGSLYLRVGEFSRAVEVFRKFIHDFPLSELLSAAYLNLGKALFELGFYLKAVEAFTRAAESASSTEEKKRALQQMADTYIKMGLWEEAIMTLQKVATLIEQNKKEIPLSIKIKMILCLLKMENRSRAREYLLPILKDFPQKEVLALIKIGDLYYQAQDMETAYKVYEKVVKILPPGQEEKLPIILLKMARIKKKSGDLNSAIKLYEKILKTDEKNSLVPSIKEETLLELADLHYQTKNYRKAYDCYSELYKEYPESGELAWCLYQMANCCHHLNLNQETKSYYRELIEKFPQSLWAKISQVMI